MIDSASSSHSHTEKPSISESVPRWSRKRLLAAAIFLLVLIIVAPPFININRFRRSIVHSISAGLGRPVEASSVELQLFPRPGFVLHNLTVSEDPAYGAEPVMMAETVTAGLRASTLWHGRVEIANLRFDAPSVNLVRNAQGRWNFEDLLVNSPALQSHRTAISEPVPFPYVEATNARINFKMGPDKLPFSLQRANLALWKEAGHKWRVRIRAYPVRTDLSIADAGEIRGEGTLISEATLMDAPIYIRLEWRRVQLGEITRLLHGEDEGWRGTVDWTARAIGTLADTALTTDIAIREFRRAEFVPSAGLELSAHCAGRYVRNDSRLDSLTCNAPLGSGQLRLRGKFPGTQPLQRDSAATDRHRARKAIAKRGRNTPAGISPHTPQADTVSLQMTLRQAPAAFFLDLLRHIHPGLSSDATASGEVNGNVDCPWHGLDTLSACTGGIHATELRLALPNLEKPLVFSPVQLVSASPAAEGNSSQGRSAPTIWQLSPSHVGLGGPSAATLTGVLTSSGALLQLRGPADLKELGKLAQTLKVPAFSGAVQSMQGAAQIAFSLQSSWLPQTGNASAMGPADIGQGSQSSTAGFAPSQWTGSLQLQNATIRLAAFPVDLQLASAQVDMLPAGVQWNALHGTLAQIPFEGSFYWQVPCSTATSACARRFDLHMADLNVSHLQAVLVHNGDSSNLINLIDSWTGSSPELPLMAGTLSAGVLSIGKVSLKKAVLKLQIQGHAAKLLGISGKIFNGSLSGEEMAATAAPSVLTSMAQGETGSMQWGKGAPVYTLRATLQHIQPENVAAIWHERWGPGTANLKIDLKTRGWSASDLAQNANGKFSVVWLNGVLSAGDVTSSTAGSTETFQQWDAKGTIHDRKLLLGSSQIIPTIPHSGNSQEQILSAGAQSVSGTISFSRMLDLKLHPSGISLKGPINMLTISAPHEKEKARSQ